MNGGTDGHVDLAVGKSSILNNPQDDGKNVKRSRALGRKKENTFGYFVIISVVIGAVTSFVLQNNLFWLVPLFVILFSIFLKRRSNANLNQKRELDLIALKTPPVQPDSVVKR